MKKKLLQFFFTSCTLLLFSVQSHADVSLPPIISDHMVLQQSTKVHLWGKALAGEAVTVSILNQKATAKADGNGKWDVWLKPMKSDIPVDITVTGKNTIVVKDVLLGEVWFGSGQSNMEWKVNQSNNADYEIANSANSQIRIFKISLKSANHPLEEVSGKWVLCGPEVVGNVSGCLYFFGRELYKSIKLPLGLIEAGWGGSPGQSWLSKAAMDEVPELKYIFTDWDKILANYPAAMEKYKTALEVWKSDSTKRTFGNRTAPRAPVGPGDKNEPVSIYNGIVLPLSPFTIKGVIWYQGEANGYVNIAYPYRFLLKALVKDWRKLWGQGDFPFIIAQISPLRNHPYWPVLRESQAVAASQLSNTALIGTIDIGDSTDIHFKNKQEAGRRFALAARNIVYGEKVEYSGPTFKSAAIEGDNIRIQYELNDGLKTKGSETLLGFKIAGADGVFLQANARIDGNTVLISNKAVLNPTSISYAFADAPVCNLFNSADLPAMPFKVPIK